MNGFDTEFIVYEAGDTEYRIEPTYSDDVYLRSAYLQVGSPLYDEYGKLSGYVTGHISFKVDFTKYNSLHFICTTDNNRSISANLGYSNKNGDIATTQFTDYVYQSYNKRNVESELDISNRTGNWYIHIDSSFAKITKIWLE